jgi:hypothetical protein
MGLYYNPQPPHIGASQPLEGKKLTPPSGPLPQSPPVLLTAATLAIILSGWAPASAAPQTSPKLVPQAVVSGPPLLNNTALQTILSAWASTAPPIQTLEQLVPPQSGPPPTNPPFAGGAEVSESVLVAWLPLPPLPPVAINLDPPIAGPTPQNPPFTGSQVPLAVLDAWIPPPPAYQTTDLIPVPISGPTPQNPPFAGTGVPESVLVAWLPPQPAAITVDLIPVPISGPAAGYVPTGAVEPLAVSVSWLPPQPAAITAVNLNPPISGPAPQNPPFPGGLEISWLDPGSLPTLPRNIAPLLPISAPSYLPANQYPVAIEISWQSFGSWQWQDLQQLTPPISGPTPQNPPISGGAQVPESVLVSWLPPPPIPPIVADNLSPPIAGPVPQNPPFVGGASVPEAVLADWIIAPPTYQSTINLNPPISAPSAFIPTPPYQVSIEISWLPSDPRFQTARNLVPPISAPPPGYLPTGATVPLAVEVAWLPLPPRPPSASILEPPQSGPVPQNPPIFGNKPDVILQSWLALPAQPQLPSYVVALLPTSTNPPFGLAPVLAIEVAWGSLQTYQLPTPTLLTPPISGPSAQVPPSNVAASVPTTVLSWYEQPAWTPSTTQPILPQPSAFVPATVLPPGIALSWAVSAYDITFSRHQTPPSSGPVSSIPPLRSSMPAGLMAWYQPEGGRFQRPVVFPPPSVPTLHITRRYVQQVQKISYNIAVPATYYVVKVPSNPGSRSMPAIAALPAVGVNQAQTMGVDFGNFLPPGVTLVGTPTVKLTTSFGNDPNPQSRISAGPVVGTISPALNGTGLANTSIIWQVEGCLPDVFYIVELSCARSDPDIAEASTRFPCYAPA